MKAVVTHHFSRSGSDNSQHHTLGYSARLDGPAEAARLADLLSACTDDFTDVRHSYHDDPRVVWFQERGGPAPEPSGRFSAMALGVFAVLLAVVPTAAFLLGTVGGHPSVFKAFWWTAVAWTAFAVVHVLVKPDERRLMQRRVDHLIARTPGAVGS